MQLTDVCMGKSNMLERELPCGMSKYRVMDPPRAAPWLPRCEKSGHNDGVLGGRLRRSWLGGEAG